MRLSESVSEVVVCVQDILIAGTDMVRKTEDKAAPRKEM